MVEWARHLYTFALPLAPGHKSTAMNDTYVLCCICKCGRWKIVTFQCQSEIVQQRVYLNHIYLPQNLTTYKINAYVRAADNASLMETCSLAAVFSYCISSPEFYCIMRISFFSLSLWNHNPPPATPKFRAQNKANLGITIYKLSMQCT